MLLVQKIWVRFPPLTFIEDGSQPPVTPVSGDLTPCSGLSRHLHTHTVHVQPGNTYIHKLKKDLRGQTPGGTKEKVLETTTLVSLCPPLKTTGSFRVCLRIAIALYDIIIISIRAAGAQTQVEKGTTMTKFPECSSNQLFLVLSTCICPGLQRKLLEVATLDSSS